MKKLLNLWAIFAVVGTTAFMTGCGGGGDDDDDENGGGAGAQGSAPASFSGKSVIVTFDGGAAPPQEIHFATAGDAFTAFVPSTQDPILTGTFQYARTGPDSATVVLTEADGTVRTINLNFTSTTGGNFSFTTNTGGTGTGTFSGLTDIPGGQQPPPGGEQPPPGGEEPPPGGEEPPPGGEEPPPGDGNPPAALTGRTVVFNVATGPLVGQTSVTFGAGNTFSASNTGSGNYTYTLTGNSASLVLDYTAPPDFVGDRDTFAMTFTSGTAGTFTGTTRIDDAESSHSGSFQVQ